MMSLLWSEHAQSDEDTGQSVASIPGGEGGERGRGRGNREIHDMAKIQKDAKRSSVYTLTFPSCDPVASISLSLLKAIQRTESSIIMKLS